MTGGSRLRPGATRLLCRGLVLALVALVQGARAADLFPARAISSPDLEAASVRLALGGLDGVYAAMVLSERAWVRILSGPLSSEVELSAAPPPQEDTVVEVGPREVAFVAFAQEERDPRDGGREVFLASNLGGRFLEPVNLSLDPADDHGPLLSVDRSGGQRVAWTRGQGEEARVVLYDSRERLARVVSRGERPSVRTGPDGRTHLAFVRGGTLRLMEETESGLGASVEVGRAEGIRALFLGVDARGRRALLYRTSSELWLAVEEGESLSFPPRLLESGLEPVEGGLDAHVAPSGRLTTSFVKEGTVQVIRGDLAAPARAEPLAAAGAGVAASPSVREDSWGHLHLAFVAQGVVHHATDAPPPRAELAAFPLEGEAPLQVEFHAVSPGPARAFRWSFGDGSRSSERDPVHTYVDPGRYTVSLQVWGPGGDARTEVEGVIHVQDPSFIMAVADSAALPGQSGVWTPVVGRHRQTIHGFQIAGRFDPRVVNLRELTLSATSTAHYLPELVTPHIDAGGGFFTVGVLLDYLEPFDGRGIPPAEVRWLLNLVYDVPPAAPPGESRIELGDDIGPSSLDCVFVVEGRAAAPLLVPGVVTVLEPQEPPLRPFLRGDLDGKDGVALTDALNVLGYLFLGQGLAACPDMADADDTGNVEIADPLHLIRYLFLGGPPPAVPFPQEGLDPTEDALPACTK